MSRTAEELSELFEQIKSKDPTGIGHAEMAVVWSDFSERLTVMEKELDSFRAIVCEMRRTSERMSATCMAGAMSWSLAETLMGRKSAAVNQDRGEG